MTGVPFPVTPPDRSHTPVGPFALIAEFENASGSPGVHDEILMTFDPVVSTNPTAPAVGPKKAVRGLMPVPGAAIVALNSTYEDKTSATIPKPICSSVAEARFILRHPELAQGREGEILAEKQKRGNAALALMDQHLGAHDFFATGRYTIADMALYGYTSVAADGGFDLSQYPAVDAWLARVAAQPGYVAAVQG